MTNTITLKFLPHLALANTEDRKNRTIRRTRHGKPGDIFYCQGIAYCITRIERECLIDSTYAYREEGYTRKGDFLQDLSTIYPDLRPEIIVFLITDGLANGLKESSLGTIIAQKSHPLTDEQYKRYEQRIKKRYPTPLYAHHYCKYGHLDLAAIGEIQPIIWGKEEVEL